MRSIDDIRRQFDEYLRGNPLGDDPPSLYDPAHYILSQGGKRMRPILLLLAHQLYRENIDRAMPAAMAVEVFHNFSLVHDDIMDKATVRRGNETVHQVYGENSAILAGDVLLIKCFDILMSACDATNTGPVLSTMFDAAVRICEGQQLDMKLETRDDVSTEEYITMSTKKTAVLLGACLKIGSLLGGASLQEAETLYAMGVELGRAFQAQDDILDAFAEEDRFGKRRGGDIIHAKKTLLYTLTLESLTGVRKQVFVELYNGKSSNPEVKIQQVLKWFDEFGIRQRAEDFQRTTYEKSLRALESLEVSSADKLRLTDYIDRLARRRS